MGLTRLILLAGVATFEFTATGRSWPPEVPKLELAAEVDAGPLPASVIAKASDPGNWVCTFSFCPTQPAHSVSLAGSFNSWNREATPLAGPGEDGCWRGEVALAGGEHEYKFVVDGQEWFVDPKNPEGRADGYGNSVLRLGRLAQLKASDAVIGDGRIDPLGLRHLNEEFQYFQTLAPDCVLVRYRTLAHDVQKVELAMMHGGVTAMSPVHSGAKFDIYEAEAEVPMVRTSDGREIRNPVVQYTFILTDGNMKVQSPVEYKREVTGGKGFSTPEWAKNAVWYQIMVDRFRNGATANDPTSAIPWTQDWFTPASHEAAGGETFYKFYVFQRLYGGDIQGVREKLGYLKSLGINAIYFNPIFKAPTHHKYDATNYLHIDDHFGVKGDYEAAAAAEDLLDPKTWQWTATDRIFLDFLNAAHEQGIRVILDGVFNHVGTEHPAFQDIKNNGKKSRFADWFDVISWDPFKYNGWAGHDSLPVFKKSPQGLASESCKQHIFNVTRRWMDPNGDGNPADGIDGWRLDVPNEIAMPFWAEWRSLVKSINPEAYITGEIWDRAESWLDGKHFDAVMNYPFARAACDWIFNKKAKIKPSDIDSKLAELRLAYPSEATYVMQNLMGSHDTDRVVSMALNPDRQYDRLNRVQDDNPKYDNSKPKTEHYAKARLALLLQMTYVGAPMIYYGDEVGMWGADDPTCRKPMIWEDLQPYEKSEENSVMKDHLEFYRQAIALRNAHPALRTGAFRSLLTDDAADVWVFLRSNETEQLIVGLNASSREAKVSVMLADTLPRTWKSVFGPPVGQALTASSRALELTLPPLGGVVFQADAR